MTGLIECASATPPPGAHWRVRQLTHQSSMRENVFEHMLLGQLGAELLARGVEYDELYSSVDKDGFDVMLEAGGIQRHTQLKVKVLGGARSEITVHTGLAARPSGCVVWLTYDPETRTFCDIQWFGGAPGEPLPDLGDRIARHTRANSQGVKAERPHHRVVPVRRFERLDDVAHLADRLFGPLPADPLSLLRSRLRSAGASEPSWAQQAGFGNFAAIPTDLTWDQAAPLADLIDGYRLLDLVGEKDHDAFLTRQHQLQEKAGSWPGDAVLLWITLFLETRAERFGANDFGDPPARLDMLCQQLRAALVELEAADA